MSKERMHTAHKSNTQYVIIIIFVQFIYSFRFFVFHLHSAFAVMLAASLDMFIFDFIN